MYSHYIDGIFSPLTMHSPDGPKAKSGQPQTQDNQVGDILRGLSQIFGGIGKHISFSNLDSGDILLVLIILFLFLEGDNLELVITLGLMLLFSLND